MVEFVLSALKDSTCENAYLVHVESSVSHSCVQRYLVVLVDRVAIQEQHTAG